MKMSRGAAIGRETMAGGGEVSKRGGWHMSEKNVHATPCAPTNQPSMQRQSREFCYYQEGISFGTKFTSCRDGPLRKKGSKAGMETCRRLPYYKQMAENKGNKNTLQQKDGRHQGREDYLHYMCCTTHFNVLITL